MSVLEKSVTELEANVPWLLKYHAIKAKITRVAYESYLREGFTPKQALELCKDM